MKHYIDDTFFRYIAQPYDTGKTAALSQSSDNSDTLSAFVAEGKLLPGGQNQTIQSS